MDIFKNNKEPITLHTANKYCKEDINVIIETDELTVIPNAEEQIKEGLYNKVTVLGDSNLIPENIKKGTSIFNVEGNMEASDGKITDVMYLFYNNARKEELQDVLKCCVGITSCERMFDTGSLFSTINLSELDISEVTTTWAMFNGCTTLQSVIFGQYIADKISIMGQMFYNCQRLKTVDLSCFDASNVINVNNIFRNCSNLTNLTSFKNFGKGFGKVANNGDYTLNLSSCTKLTYDSLMSVINNLYDLNLTYDTANGGTLYRQTVNIGSTNKVKLEETEEGLLALAEADRKGWNIT